MLKPRPYWETTFGDERSAAEEDVYDACFLEEAEEEGSLSVEEISFMRGYVAA